MQYNNELTHLTFTGYYAGVPICGINKESARLRGDLFVHAVYAPLDNKDINFCPACMLAWEDAQDDHQ